MKQENKEEKLSNENFSIQEGFGCFLMFIGAGGFIVLCAIAIYIVVLTLGNK